MLLVAGTPFLEKCSFTLQVDPRFDNAVDMIRKGVFGWEVGLRTADWSCFVVNCTGVQCLQSEWPVWMRT